MPKAKRVLLVFFLFTLLPLVSADTISEIMYRPAFDENYNEWIEIYSGEEIDLTGATLCGKDLLPGYIDHADRQTYAENGLILEANSYAVITDGGSGTEVYTNYDVGSSLALHVGAGTLCTGLNNNGETIILETTNGVDEVTYPDNAEDGNSLQLISNEWCEGVATPGFDNFCSNQPSGQPPPEEEQEEQQQQEEKQKESEVQIKDSPAKAEFGEIIQIEIYVYRGDTNKYAIYAYIENSNGDKVSEKTTLHANSKYTEYAMEIPIQIQNKCGKSEYKIILKGLGEEDKELIELTDNKNCQEQVTPKKLEIVETIREPTPTITGEVTGSTTKPAIETTKIIYEADNRLLRKIALYLLITTAVLLSWIVLKKKLI